MSLQLITEFLSPYWAAIRGSLGAGAALKCITEAIHAPHLSLSADSLWQRQARAAQPLHRALLAIK